MDKKVQQSLATINRRIAEVEEEILAWRRRNSQSNPGAAPEMRELRARLNVLQKIREEVRLMATE